MTLREYEYRPTLLGVLHVMGESLGEMMPHNVLAAALRGGASGPLPRAIDVDALLAELEAERAKMSLDEATLEAKTPDVLSTFLGLPSYGVSLKYRREAPIL